MSDIKLFNGLINLGGILTETYYRKSRATTEAKAELGLDPGKEYNASIGIASVSEVVTETLTGLTPNQKRTFDVAKYQQTLKLVGLYCSNQNDARFDIQLQLGTDTPAYKYTVNKNLAFYPVPTLIVPEGHILSITSVIAQGSITAVFEPCAVLLPIPESPSGIGQPQPG